jgi:hypothetical protein
LLLTMFLGLQYFILLDIISIIYYGEKIPFNKNYSVV